MMNGKKILIILNYYYPYVSGVSEYARVLAEELAERKYDVTVLTSNHAKLENKTIKNNVKVIRARIICHISKGTISPHFIRLAIKMSREADVVNLHLPMIESGLISRFIPQNKLITTYHCDINLPNNIMNSFITKL